MKEVRGTKGESEPQSSIFPCNKLHNMSTVHAMNTDAGPEIRYRIFKILDNNPRLTQRQMAGEMGISLGKFNYCLTALVKKGFVKMDRFRSSANKTAYMYILTPRGLEEKARVTSRFLHRKMEEFTKR